MKIYNNYFTECFGELPTCLEALVTEELNGVFELEITYPIYSLNWDKLERGNIIVTNANDTLLNQKFRIYRRSKPLNGKLKVYANHITYDLYKDMIDSIDLKEKSCEYCLNYIFSNSQFSKHFRGHSDIVNVQNFKIGATKVLKAILGTKGSIIDTFGLGAEILKDNEDIYVLNNRGADNGVEIEYAKNLISFNDDIDDTDLITRIKPYARYNDNGEEIIVQSNPKYIDSPLIDNYETPYTEEIDFSEKFENDEKPTGEKLKALALEYFKNNKCDIVKQNYTIEFIPNGLIIGLGDTVTVTNKRYNTILKSKVIKTVYNVLTKKYKKIELGQSKSKLTNVIATTSTTITNNTGSSNNNNNNNGSNNGNNGSTTQGTITEKNFPTTIPENAPILSAKVINNSIDLEWTYFDKIYYTYELHCDKNKGFTPSNSTLILSCNMNRYTHNPNTTDIIYYKVCAKNTHNTRTKYSNEVEISIATNTIGATDFGGSGKIANGECEIVTPYNLDNACIFLSNIGKERLYVKQINDKTFIVTADSESDLSEEIKFKYFVKFLS